MRYWLEAIFTLLLSLCGLGYKSVLHKVKMHDSRQTAIEKGIQALLRDRIIRAYNHCMENGFCPIYALENIEALYEQYHALGGNGAITSLVNKLKELPTEREND